MNMEDAAFMNQNPFYDDNDGDIDNLEMRENEDLN